MANPPFFAKWSANPLHMNDDRFSQYGPLAPKSKADFAFVQHMLHQLDENGTMAVILPHGVLFRGAAEGAIRKYLIEDLSLQYDDLLDLSKKLKRSRNTIRECVLFANDADEAQACLY